MKIMLSQPMAGKSEEEILKERQKYINKLNKMHIDVLDSYIKENPLDEMNPGVFYLSKSLYCLAQADAILMCNNWEKSKGCILEYYVARSYGIKILFEDFIDKKDQINTIFNPFKNSFVNSIESNFKNTFSDLLKNKEN